MLPSLFAGQPLPNGRGSVRRFILSRDHKGADAQPVLAPCLGMRGLFAVTRGWERGYPLGPSPLQRPPCRGRACPARRIFTGLILLVLSATGQQQPAQQPARRVTFTANASLVIVDVTVKDKSGKAIDSLTQNDFTVLEDGKPQKISVFEVQKLAMEPAPPPPPPTLDDVNAIPEPPKTTITTEEPGKVQYHDKRLMVLFFDFSSMGIPSSCARRKRR